MLNDPEPTLSKLGRAKLTKAKNVHTMSGISLQRMRWPRCCQRGFEENPMGARKMHVQVTQIPARKDANIQ